jgi:hypothetical protein
MWTKAHRERHEARLKEFVSLHVFCLAAQRLKRLDPLRRARAVRCAVVSALAWQSAGGRSLAGAASRAYAWAHP